ncbi:XRE family transcriptional regulator [Streptococcus suis]|nr:XRE family transcriptional regulator [Streptococcus suis]MDG3162117.1 XRE family transcriptional regulator [Streptococcus suis]
MAFNSFEKLLQSNYYNDIFKAVDNYIYHHRSYISVKSHTVEDPNFKKLDDFAIKKVLSRKVRDGIIVSELQVIASLEIKGQTKYGYEIDSANLWLRMTVEYELNEGIHNFTVLQVNPFDPKDYDNSELGLSPEFVPYIKAKDMDEIAEGILKQYYPQALEAPMALPIDGYLANIGLTKMEGKLTEDSSIFGEMVFKDTEVLFYDEDTPESRLVKKKTILVDPEVICLRNQGSYNNTIVHESVHWLLHRHHNEYKMLFDQNHKRSSSLRDNTISSSSEWRDYDWMEWQANGIAARILMPKSMTRQKVNQLFTDYSLKYASDKKLTMFERIIDDLAEFFQVSRLAAKIRLQQLGYHEFEGIYNFVGDEYLRSYGCELKAMTENKSFTIAFSNACLLSWKNEQFRKLMDSGRYVYVDNHFCLNDPQYVNMVEYGIYEMTDYAYKHMDECCLLFDIFYKTDKNKSISITIFNEYVMYRGKSTVEIEVDFSEFTNIVNGSIILDSGRIFEEVVRINDEMPSGFCAMLIYHRTRKNITQEDLAEASGVSLSTIQRFETQRDASRKLEKMMGITLGMKLYPDFSFKLIEKSGTTFRDEMPTHCAYKMLLRYYYHLGAYECNQKLIEMKIPEFWEK